MYEDLEIFKNKSNTQSLVLCDVLSKTHTFMGKSIFKYKLSNIISNVDDLTKEQDKIKKLCGLLENTCVFNSIEKHLKLIKENEKFILSLFLENKDEANLLKLIYFNEHFEYFKLNENEDIMSTYNTFTMYSP